MDFKRSYENGYKDRGDGMVMEDENYGLLEPLSEEDIDFDEV